MIEKESGENDNTVKAMDYLVGNAPEKLTIIIFKTNVLHYSNKNALICYKRALTLYGLFGSFKCFWSISAQ